MTQHGKFHGSPNTTRETRLTKWVESLKQQREIERGSGIAGKQGEGECGCDVGSERKAKLQRERPSSRREWRKKKNDENENERKSIEGGAATA